MRTANGKTKGDFGGFNKEDWELRNGQDHKLAARRCKEAKNEAQLKELESIGCRWSELFLLGYFDPIEHHAVDVMHCIFLGIAKTMTKFYLTSGLVKKEDFHKLQSKIDSIRVPSTVGRIPRKIASGFTSFTSDQWKNWILVYSAIVLRDFLPQADFKIWMKFVHATGLLTKKIVSHANILLADQLILSFCKAVEQKYGRALVTPNFHMMCHIAQVMRTYGPVYSFWCYSFERYV